MPWVCKSAFISRSRRQSPALSVLPLTPAAGLGIGKIVRGHMRHTWGLSHRGARHAYGTLVTCVFVGAPAAAGAAWGAGRYLPGVWRDVAGGAVAAIGAPFAPVAVPEPSSLGVFVIAVVALALIRRRV